MDSKELRDLMKAYQQVYAPIAEEMHKDGDEDEEDKMKKGKNSKKERDDEDEEEEELDEATAMAKRGYDEAPIRQKIAKSTGGGESADRASELEKKSTFGDAKKAKQRQDLARKQRGDFRKTTSSSPGLHGYAHKSDDPKVKEKQAARGAQRGALTPAEKKQFNREEIQIGEAVKGASSEMRKAAAAERKAGDKPLSKSEGDKHAANMKRKIEFADKISKAKGHMPGYAYAEQKENLEATGLFSAEEIERILDIMCEDQFDEALTGERYKKAVKKPGGTAYSRMVSADPSKRATRGGRGGESDFGAGDRGAGNKSRRRRGLPVGEED